MKIKKILITTVITFLSLNSVAESYQVQIPLKTRISNSSTEPDDSQNGGDVTITNFDKISCGGYHCYGIKDSKLYSVGQGSYGQLGLGTNELHKTWQYIPDMDGTTDVSAGAYHGYAIKNGQLYSVGYNVRGQLGSGNLFNKTKFEYISGMDGVSAISAGAMFGYAIKGGQLFSVGRNDFGQLGTGTSTTSNKTTWTPATGMTSGVTKISAGGSHGFAIKDGKLYSVGDNQYGQLGLDTTISYYGTFQQSATMDGTTDIYSGSYFTYAIKNGKLYTVGKNDYGQLGIGGLAGSFYKKWNYISAMDGVTSIAAGESFGYVIKNNQLFSTGRNIYGQLGLGTTTDHTSFQYVASMDGVTSIETSLLSAYASIGEQAYAVGYNGQGQLGIDYQEAYSANFLPVEVVLSENKI